MAMATILFGSLVTAAMAQDESNVQDPGQAERRLAVLPRNNPDDLLAFCQAIDAGILAMRSELEFFSFFELRSEWRGAHVSDLEDLGAFGRDSGPEMEAADGTLFCLDNSVGITFDLKSDLTTDGSFYSYKLFERSRHALKYWPRQQYKNGTFLSESAHLWVVEPGRSMFIETMPGLYFSPWVSLGLNTGSLFSDRLKTNQYTVSIDEEFDTLADRPLLVVRLIRRGTDSYDLLCRLDVSGKYPVLHEIHHSSENRIRFLDFVELGNGIQFPATTITSRGPFKLANATRDQYDVKVWRMLGLGDRKPSRDDFKLRLDEAVELRGSGEKIPAGPFDVFEFLENPVLQAPSTQSQSARIVAADLDWQSRHAPPAGGARRWLNVGAILIVVFAIAMTILWLRRGALREKP